MNQENFVQRINQYENRYHPNAYLFVLEALRHTQTLFKKPRHVTGQELLIGLTRLAKERYGTLALTVFNEWNILSSRDFGNIVFNLVDMGEIKKTEEDCIDDFDMGFDLQKELSQTEYSN